MKKERVDAGQVYVDLINKIKKIESDVDPAEIEELKRDVDRLYTLVPDGASSDNRFALASDISAIDLDIETLSASVSAVGLDVAGINSVIPSSASSSNKLVTEDEVPAAQVNADWNASSGVAEILNKPTIPTVHNPIQQELIITTGNWNYDSVDKSYKKTFTLATPLNPDYSPTISNIQYMPGSVPCNWIRTIYGGYLSSNGATLQIWAFKEPPEDNIRVFVQGWS